MSQNKNTQYVVMGMLAVAAAGVVYYVSKQQQSTTKSKKLDDDNDLSDDVTVKAKGRSFDFSGVKSTTVDSTEDDDMNNKEKSVEPIGEMDEKTLHARIEDLDKKGKAFFKNKQVSLVCRRSIFLGMCFSGLPH